MMQVKETEQEWTRVCALTDILPNTGVCVLLAGEQVAVFRVGGGETCFAIGNFDPFSRANVLSRGLVGDRNGRIKVASPIFKQNFCLKTGECLDDDTVSVPAYDLRVVANGIEIRKAAQKRLPKVEIALVN
ncbi:MAG: nitrite reductase small subunit NirD [Myxococcales bacterium]